MKTKLTALGAALMFFATLTGGALAQGTGIKVTDAWARAMPGGAQTAAAYVTITSTSADRLTGVSTPAAQKAELHTMTMDNGVMKMRQVDGIDLPAGKTVALKPGGYHIMLMGLAQPLKEGQTFPLTLTFQKAGTQQVTVAVQKIGAMGPGAMTGSPMPMHH